MVVDADKHLIRHGDLARQERGRLDAALGQAGLGIADLRRFGCHDRDAVHLGRIECAQGVGDLVRILILDMHDVSLRRFGREGQVRLGDARDPLRQELVAGARRAAFEKWRTGYASADAVIPFGLASIYVRALNKVCCTRI